MPKIIAMIIESVILVCALWVLFFLSTFLHEAGHALGYIIATGDSHFHIRVGSGKKLFKTRRLTVKLLPFDGCFMPAEKDKADTKAKLITMLSGGPAISLILSAVLLVAKSGRISLHSEVISSDAVEFFISCALSVNLFIMILSLIPAHYFFGEIKGMETDGLQILHAMKEKTEEYGKTVL